MSAPPRILPTEPSSTVLHLARQWLAHISAIRGDDEAAHAAEDDLWFGALFWIEHRGAQHPDVAAQLAGIATDTVGIKFSRWYA